MNFACPPSLPLATVRIKRNFVTHPLESNDPSAYFKYLPFIFSKIKALGIDVYFPPNFSMIPLEPLIAPPIGSTIAEIQAHAILVTERARLVDLYDYVQPSMANEHIHALNLKFSAHNASVAQISAIVAANLLVPGTYPPLPIPAPRFTNDDTQLLIAITAVKTQEDRLRELQIKTIGPFIIEMTTTLFLSLGNLFDQHSETDRPEPQSKNGIVRKVLFSLETLCRGESYTHSKVLQTMYETIGRAETVSQANMILDQFDYAKGIFDAYVTRLIIMKLKAYLLTEHILLTSVIAFLIKESCMNSVRSLKRN